MSQIRAELQLNCERFLSAIKTVDAAVGGFEKRLTRFAAGFAGLAAAGTVAAVTVNKFASAFQSALGSAAETEDFETSFNTLLGGADKARARISELTRFANETPFDLPGVTKASKALEVLTRGAMSTGAGLTLVGDVAASTGEPFEDIAVHIGRLYDGLQNGRPVGATMARLQQLGAISSEARARIEALQKAGESGNAVWSIAADELGRFTGEMEKRSQAWNGLRSTLGDEWQTLQGILGKPLIESLKPALESFIAGLADLAPQVALTGDLIGGFVSGCISVAKAGATAGTAIAKLAPVFMGLTGAMVLNSIQARITGGILTMTLPNACRASIGGLLSLRASLTTTSLSFSSMGTAAKGAAASAVAAGRSILAAFGPIGIAIAAATAGFSYMAKEAEKSKAMVQALTDLMDEQDTRFDRNRSAMNNVATEDERASVLKDLNEQLLEVERRISRIDIDFGDRLDEEGIKAVTNSLETQAQVIRVQQRQLKGLSSELLIARKAERDLAAAAEEAKEKFEELRKELSKGAEELAKVKADDAFGALSAIDQRNQLLRESGNLTAEQIDQEIQLHNIQLRAGRLGDPEAQRLAQLLNIRKQLVGVERRITQEREKQAQKAEEAATQALVEAADARVQREIYERSNNLEMRKLMAQVLGDEQAEKTIDRAQRRQRYFDEAVGAGVDVDRARELASQKVNLEDEAEKTKEQRAADLRAKAGGGSDSDRRVGLGGVAWGGDRKDPMVKAQQDSTRAINLLTGVMKDVLGQMKKDPQRIVRPGYPVFQ